MQLVVLDTSFEMVTIIDAYESMIWTDRFDEVGDFELKMAVNTELFRYLQQNFYLWLKESDRCMIIEDIEIESDVENGNRLTVTGRSLESILDRRIIWGQRIFNGNLQDAIQTMLNENIISPSIAERKISNFVFQKSDDPVITGLTIDEQYTGDDLLSVIEKLCKENHIGFRVMLTEQNQFQFSLYAGKDYSYRQTTNPYVIFSPNFDNMINSNFFSSNAGMKNVTLVGGEGEGASRKLLSVGSGTGLERREVFTDASGISTDTKDGKLTDEAYNAQMRSKGSKTLSENQAITAFEGEAEVSKMFVYGRDFVIGDIVQISDDYGHEGASRISELVISRDDTGLQIYPTFQTVETKEG